MADEITYESEMNQPIHRPGMESVVNRGNSGSVSGTIDRSGSKTMSTMDKLPPTNAKPASKISSRSSPMPIMQGRDSDGNETQDDRPTVSPGHVDPFSVKGDPAPKAAPKPAATPPDPSTGIGGRDREATIMGQADQAVTG